MRWMLLALLPRIAAADTEPERIDEWAERVTFGRGGYTNKLGWTAHAAISGRAGRDTDVKTSGAGELAWIVGHCKAVFAGAAGAYDDAWSGAAWGGICIPFPQVKTEVTIREDYQLQPSFAALPIALRSRFEGATIEMRSAIIPFDDGSVDHEVFVVDLSVGTFRQEMLDGTFARGAIDFAFYRHHDTKTGRMIAAVPFEVRSTGPFDGEGNQSLYWSVTSVNVSPIGLTKFPIGSAAGFAIDGDAAAGLAHAAIYQPPPDEMQRGTRLFGANNLFVDATVRATRDGDVLAAKLRRAFEPTMFDQLLFDTRGEASWTRDRGSNTFAASAFAAHTSRYDRTGKIESTPTGGVRAAYVRRLWGHVQLTLAAEGARSFFAKLDDTVALDAQWAAQTSATISVAK